jgi:hypothetical protein
MSYAMRFARPLENLLRSAASVVVSNGTPLDGYDVANLFNRNWAKPFKIAEVDLDLDFTFATPTAIPLVAILNSNLNVAARLQGSSHADYSVLAVDQPFAVPTRNARGFFSAPWLADLGAYENWRLHIVGNALPIILGEFWPASIARGFSRTYQRADAAPGSTGTTIVNRTYGGSELAIEQATPVDTFGGTLALDDDEFLELSELVSAGRLQQRPFLLVPRTDRQDAWMAKYGADTVGQALPVDGLTRVAFPARQISRGLPWVDPDDD